MRSLPSDKCNTLAIFFIVASTLESAWSISVPNSSSILPGRIINRKSFSSSPSTYTACSSSSLEMCSDMFLMLPILSDIRSIVSSCCLSSSCCCSSCTMYSLHGQNVKVYPAIQTVTCEGSQQCWEVCCTCWHPN